MRILLALSQPRAELVEFAIFSPPVVEKGPTPHDGTFIFYSSSYDIYGSTLTQVPGIKASYGTLVYLAG